MPELNHTRYKIIVQVLIGEQKGEGLRIATRCLWDPEADNYASHTFISVSWIGFSTQLQLGSIKLQCNFVFAPTGFPILLCCCIWCLLLLRQIAGSLMKSQLKSNDGNFYFSLHSFLMFCSIKSLKMKTILNIIDLLANITDQHNEDNREIRIY